MQLRGRRNGLTLVVAAVLYCALLIFLRGRPSFEADDGIFLSVAGRLVHGGNHLYTGVWDNKPPFFYYAQALALDLGEWRGLFALDVLWLYIACLSMGLLLATIGVPAPTVAVGAILYPLLLTGAWYFTGESELPPLALAPVIGCLWLRGQPVATGTLLGAMAFLRPDYALVFAAMVLGPLAVRTWRETVTAAGAARLILGILAGAGVSAAIVAVRGELSGYLDTIRSDVGYTNRALTTLGKPTGIHGHIDVIHQQLLSGKARPALLILVLVGLVGLAVIARRRSPAGREGWQPESGDGRATSAALLISTGLAVTVTLVLAALWDHNMELVALPGTFAACVLFSEIRERIQNPVGLVAAIGATLVCVFAFGGVTSSTPGAGATQPLSAWWHTPTSISAELLDRAAAQVRPRRGNVTYARLGQNYDDAQGEFIDDRLHLTCPIFQQYPFSSNLGSALTCIRAHHPQLVLAGPGLTSARTDGRRWEAFLRSSRELLRSGYIEVSSRRDDKGTAAVYRRR